MRIILLSILRECCCWLIFYNQNRKRGRREKSTLWFLLCSILYLWYSICCMKFTLNASTLKCLHFQQRGHNSQAELGHLERFTKISMGYRHKTFLSCWSGLRTWWVSKILLFFLLKNRINQRSWSHIWTWTSQQRFAKCSKKSEYLVTDHEIFSSKKQNKQNKRDLIMLGYSFLLMTLFSSSSCLGSSTRTLTASPVWNCWLTFWLWQLGLLSTPTGNAEDH